MALAVFGAMSEKKSKNGKWRDHFLKSRKAWGTRDRPEHRGRLPRRGAFPTGMGKERPPPQDSASSKRDKMSQAVTTPVNMPSWPPGTALASSTANEIRKKYPVGSVWYEPDEPREGEELAPTFL